MSNKGWPSLRTIVTGSLNRRPTTKNARDAGWRWRKAIHSRKLDSTNHAVRLQLGHRTVKSRSSNLDGFVIVELPHVITLPSRKGRRPWRAEVRTAGTGQVCQELYDALIDLQRRSPSHSTPSARDAEKTGHQVRLKALNRCRHDDSVWFSLNHHRSLPGKSGESPGEARPPGAVTAFLTA
jgi:hypothetical protein